MKLEFHYYETPVSLWMKLKMLFFSSKIEILKKGAPLRRGLALPRIDATSKVDITPYPM
jgi:hypothetical protein